MADDLVGSKDQAAKDQAEDQVTPGNDVQAATAVTADLETTQQETAELLAALAQAQAERDAALATAETAAAEAETRVADATARLIAAQAQALDAERRALIAAHPGIIPELVAGNSVDELQASVAVARSAYARAVEAARTQLAQTQVPAGASTHDASADVENLSPLERISRGLWGNHSR